MKRKSIAFCLSWLAAILAVHAVPQGFLDVTSLGADPSGQTDSTAAIQQAINQGRDTQMVVWFPGGTYRISNRLLADQPDNGSSNPCVLIGSTIDPENRATLFLAPDSPGFNDPANRKAVLHFINIGTPENESGNTDLYNQAVIGIDFRIGTGNPGAVALRMQGAEGCTIQDVNIDLTEGGHTGIWGIPGSGGSTHRVTIVGGEYGIDTRTINLGPGGSQPTIVVTGSNFINQRGRALFATTRGSFVLVGCRILSDGSGPVILLQRHWAGQPFDASLQLIDCSIEYSVFNRLNIAVEMTGSFGRSFYLHNTYLRNARRLWGTINANQTGFTLYRHAAIHIKPETRNWWNPDESIYIDGQKFGDLFVDSINGAEPPADLQTRHQWPDDFPTWESEGVIDVTTLGANGNGVDDNWSILQQAIDEHEVLFFPKGDFKVSRTLNLRPESKLIGAYHAFTTIGALSTLANRFAGVVDGEPDQPIIRTANRADANTYLAFLHLRRAWPLASHNPTPPGNYSIEWRCGGESLVRHVELQSRTAFNVRPDLIAKNYYQLSNTINPNHPQADFPDGMWAWPCNDPTIQIRGNGGGRWFNFWMHGRQGLREDTPFLRIDGTAQPLHIYHLHLQQQDSRNHAEVLNARNVSIYGTKAELKGSLVYYENSTDIRHFGNGGLSSPDHNYNPPYLFRFIDCDDFLISGLGDTINEGGDTWIGGIFDRWISNHFRNWHPIQDRAEGRAEVIIPSAERPILYLRGAPSTTPPSVPPLPAPWSEATPGYGAFQLLPWFGWLSHVGSGFVYHTDHGFIYSESIDATDLWFWDSQLGWLWTRADLYPYLYRGSTGHWIHYQTGGSPTARTFFDFDPSVNDFFTVP